MHDDRGGSISLADRYSDVVKKFARFVTWATVHYNPLRNSVSDDCRDGHQRSSGTIFLFRPVVGTA
jgi:hypothetical protein